MRKASDIFRLISEARKQHRICVKHRREGLENPLTRRLYERAMNAIDACEEQINARKTVWAFDIINAEAVNMLKTGTSGRIYIILA